MRRVGPEHLVDGDDEDLVEEPRVFRASRAMDAVERAGDVAAAQPGLQGVSQRDWSSASNAAGDSTSTGDE